MIEGQTKVYFNADFDSGNLQNVEQLSPYVVDNTLMSSISYILDLIR